MPTLAVEDVLLAAVVLSTDIRSRKATLRAARQGQDAAGAVRTGTVRWRL